MQLEPRQRLALIQHLNALVPSQFEALVFTLDVPKGLLPSNVAAQGDRSATLLYWVTSPTGCGMETLLDILGTIAPLPAILSNDSRGVDAADVSPLPSPAIVPGLESIQIFLAHAKEDEAQVIELYKRLRAKGYRPWLDKQDLIPGQNWRVEIPKAIKASQLFIACLSQTSVKKQGYIQREFRLALSELANKPSGQIYLIPLRLDDCELPDLRLEEYGVNLRDYYWLDYFETDGFERLERTIQYQLDVLSLSQEEDNLPLESPSSKPTPSESTQNNTDGTNFQASVQGEVVYQAKMMTINQQVVKDSSPQESKESQQLPEGTLELEVVKVNEQGKIIDRQTVQTSCVIENLGNGITLALVKIPEGTFLMGSPPDELGRNDNEGPQHKVTVPSFWMGRYPITQEQWKAIASLPEVNRTLNPEPSHFKGENHPVEQVSWYEAVEFCDRLSAHTHRSYRLPSEAEWEYACRAGTTTPFYFGKTITTDLANYRGTDWKMLITLAQGAYGNGPLGKYRERTTPVEQFKTANKWGLSDMHGNVREWCLDHLHENYHGSPSDGTAWLETPPQSNDRRVNRGGSWFNNPRFCRSAYRVLNYPIEQGSGIGFRVVLAPR